MKFAVHLKDPNGFNAFIREAAEESVGNTGPYDLTPEERETLIASRIEELNKAIRPWVEDDEYISIEFDTEAKTATVLPVEPTEEVIEPSH